MDMPRLRTTVITALAVLCSPALFALDMQNFQPASSAVPGTLNYVEGSVSVDGQPLTQRSIGSLAVHPGEEISTANGRAELLLTPGVYFRLGENSEAKMVSPELTNTVVELDLGRAAVEVDQIYKENALHVLENQVPVQLVKPGLYEFDAESNSVKVFKGEAAALRPNEKFVAVKSGHELNLSDNAELKPVKFDVNAEEQSGLYRWSSLRSDYLSQANQQIASTYGEGYAPGWYWDPYMIGYTFIGPSPFYSPFGWSFYPLGWAGGGGWGYPGWGLGGGYYGGTRWVGPHGPLNLQRGGFGPNPGTHGGHVGGHGR